MSNCLVCAGYSSHNCPCCRPEPVLPMQLIYDGIEAVAESLDLKSIHHPEGIENEIWRWCFDNLDPDIRQDVAELISEALHNG